LNETLNYNEHKVRKGAAVCIAENNFLLPLSAMNFYHKLDWFESRNDLNTRATTKTLHVSLNFATTENFTPEKLTAISREYMERIGFGDQPYLVYQHKDAGHPHVHIVATTIRDDGTGSTPTTSERINLRLHGNWLKKSTGWLKQAN
jgi:hypothetical protein